MAAVELATGYIALVPSAKGIGAALAKELSPIEGIAGAAGQRAGGQLKSGMTGQLAGLAKASVPLLAIGAAAIGSAVSVENAQNTIIRSTGATGRVADGLRKSFEAVASKTPASFQTVAAALSEVHERTGLTGTGLETLTRQVVSFNRITKDAPVNVQDLTKSLAGFNVPASGTSAQLDRLFKISQKTGVPLTDLVSTLGSAGPILRQFKLPVDQSASLLAKLDKAGVDSSATIGGLRHAFTTFAKAGEDPKKALIGVLGQIDTLVKSGNTVGAQQLGVKIFGARGVGIVDAAIKGKLSIADLTKTVNTAGPGILQTASATSTLAAKLLVLEHRAELAFAKFGTPVLKAATGALASAIPPISSLINGFGNLPGPLQKVALGFVGITAAAGPIRKIGGIVSANIRAIVNSGKAVAGVVKGVASFGKTALTTALDIGKQTAAFVLQKGAMVAAAIAQKAMAAAQWLLNVAMDANPVVLIVAGIAALVAGVVLAYQHFGPFRTVVDAVGRALGTVARVITGAVAAAFGWVKSHWPLLLAILTGPIGLAVLVITKNWDRIKAGVVALKNFIGARISEVVGFFLFLPLRITAAVGNLAELLLQKGRDLVGGLLTGVRNVAGGLFRFFTNLGGTILAKIGDASHWLYDIGGKIISGLIDGIKHSLGGLGKVLGGVGKFISDHKGPPAADAVLLEPAGRLIIQGLSKGIGAELPSLRRQLAHVTAAFTAAPMKFATPSGAGSRRRAEFAVPSFPTLQPNAARITFPRSPAELVGSTAKAVTVHQENHYHGHEMPTRADAQHAGVQLAWLVRNSGRRA